MSGSYEDSWDEFRRRTFPRYAIFCKFLQEKYPSVFASATSMLDIGAGDGDFDDILIREYLPKVTHYSAVEADADLCRTLEKKISDIENRNIQVSVFHGLMEPYGGPSQPVDLIVMCAVAYYIKDQKKMVQDALSWLKPGGHFIMIHWPHNTPIMKGQDAIRAANSGTIDASFDGAPLLREMGLKFTDHKMDVPFDVTREGLEKVLRIVLHRVPTDEEADKFSAALEQYSEKKDGKRYVAMPYSILVIPKN